MAVVPEGHPAGRGQATLGIIAWETTRACPLACKHCRAAAQPTASPAELTPAEGLRLLECIAAFAKPTIILTGGEPMLRPDIYRLAARARELGLNPVLAPCGMFLTDETARRLVEAGIRHISLSLDGATAETHDAFRGAPGAFVGCLRAVEAARGAGLAFQINTVVTRHNLHELPAILELATRLGASVFNPFLLVPTGRGQLIADQAIEPRQYEETLEWLAERRQAGLAIRVTCAPHYQRVLRQKRTKQLTCLAPGGCLGGKAFAFVSAAGKVQTCGFLDLECGDLRRESFDFRKIWQTAPVFLKLRNADNLAGKCGLCEFRHVCGGCRARAFALTGDYLGEEPFCVYRPQRTKAAISAEPLSAPNATLDDLNRRILNRAQADLPVARRPYRALAEALGTTPELVLERLAALRQAGLIRRLGPVFDARRLGYVSTLVGAKVPQEQLESVAAAVSRLPQVSHNYQRRHAYNLWFTLTASSQKLLESILSELRRNCPDAAFQDFPALAVFKRRAVFQLPQGEQPPATPARREHSEVKPVPMSDEQKRLVALLQHDLPLTDEPFAVAALALGWPAKRVLDQIRDWLNQGVIRRFGAVVDHRRLGYVANAMAVFTVAPDRAHEAGACLARRPQISHCYLRPRATDWPYDLFAMVHATTEGQIVELVRTAAAELGLSTYEVLFSVKEFKKVSIRYFVDHAP